jgi:hypothetical protein
LDAEREHSGETEQPLERAALTRRPRREGLRTLGLGAVLLALAALCGAIQNQDLAGELAFFGALALVGGTWRALTGESSGHERRGLVWSILRIALGLVLLVVVIAAIFAAGMALSARCGP